MIIAGEASGDLHGAQLVLAMKEKDSSLFFCGIGGQALKKAGTKIIVDNSEITVMGITEVLFKIPAILKGLAAAKKTLQSLHPDLLILIDFADFNLRVASYAKKTGIPVLYYIPPKVWAWRSGRVNKIRNLVDHVAVILPFEEEFFKKHNVPVTYVGNPLLDYDLPQVKSDVKHETGESIVIGLLPGSRNGEVTKLLPVMLDAAHLISKEMNNIKFIISVAPSMEKAYVEKKIREHPGPASFEIETGSVYTVFQKSFMVVAASGTVTLETAICGIPTVIIYKISPVSYWIGRAFIKAEYAGLASLIAGEEVFPELLQNDASPEKVSEKVCELLTDAEALKTMRKKLFGIKDKMGSRGVSERTAELAFSLMNTGKK